LVQLLVFGVPVLIALVAYLLPGVRVLRSIAGAICLLVAAVLTIRATEAGPDEWLQIMAMVVVLSALVIAVRPERKPKPAESAPPVRPAPLAQPYAQQGYSAQPQSHLQSPTQPQPLSEQHQPQHAQPQQPLPQRQPEHSVQTPPAQPPQPQRAMPPQTPPQQPGPGYPGSGS
jgi:hypothetical protein